MFQGTGSSVGKSVLVAGIARALTRRGLKVRPFKPQNMSNNAAVTRDGGEIGRAQALQARACGVAPTVDMNPVLLKPQSETGSQLVVCGKVRGTIRAREYQDVKKALMPEVLGAFRRLATEADIVLIEGAGSASEVNLRANDIANMGFAEAANVNVVLVGDIDRGGVIASLVGTNTVLPDGDAARIKGFIVNKMRGDASLFSAGMAVVAQQTGWAPLGLVTHLARVGDLPAEDASDLIASINVSGGLRIVVPHLPTIANFDDLDPLKSDPGVSLDIIPPGQPLPVCDLVILPGSKATISDLKVFKEQGWDIDLKAHVRRGGRVLGICGGYQMLGRTIEDREGIEGPSGITEGLGLLDVETVLTKDKRLTEVRGMLLPEKIAMSGYEIHIGRTTGPDCSRPFADLDGQPDGAVSANGQVWGTYLHGLLWGGKARAALLARLGMPLTLLQDQDARVEAALDEWADHLEKCLNLELLLSLAQPV
ncbi:cobyric acid synthase [Gluconobacter frateurii]|uniref:cobyric acid synthase n=1 Tax=Gluconobacter frateurii TaxID=38308 RepID=UPI001F0705FC|nr:cobyric acid synthase [Gluconobacter frateurii]UMM10021.1 cobyric acid synthase [Gluconobacter frateurii]